MTHVAQTDKMHGVQHIGFAHAIQSREAVEPRREFERLLPVVFEVRELEAVEVHGRGEDTVRSRAGLRSNNLLN